MDRSANDLRDVPEDRQSAARWFLRADYAAGRVIYLKIAAVLGLAAVLFLLFAGITLVTAGVGAALRAAIVPAILSLAAVGVARRRPRRLTDMDLS